MSEDDLAGQSCRFCGSSANNEVEGALIRPCPCSAPGHVKCIVEQILRNGSSQCERCGLCFHYRVTSPSWRQMCEDDAVRKSCLRWFTLATIYLISTTHLHTFAWEYFDRVAADLHFTIRFISRVIITFQTLAWSFVPFLLYFIVSLIVLQWYYLAVDIAVLPYEPTKNPTVEINLDDDIDGGLSLPVMRNMARTSHISVVVDENHITARIRRPVATNFMTIANFRRTSRPNPAV